MGELYTVLLDVEEVGVGVHVVQPVRVNIIQLFEVLHCLVYLDCRSDNISESFKVDLSNKCAAHT